MIAKARIAILQTGRNNPHLRPDQPDYPALFRDLLGKADKKARLDMISVPVLENIFPASPADFDGYLLTGSAAGVYEDHDWLAPLGDFVQQAYALGKPLVGVCFGHQFLAKALGGEAEKSAKGWGYGIRQTPLLLPVADQPPEVQAAELTDLSLIYSHQDQVTRLPAGARIVSGDAFCPHAAFTMGDQLLSIQGHPEFTPAYADNLYEVMADRVGRDLSDQARASLKHRNDGQLMASWMVRVLLQEQA